jgi:Uncharacterised nucleotidyltransferase
MRSEVCIANPAVCPPLQMVHRALRETTETLAHELAQSGKQTPQWSELQWVIARATAIIHGVSPLLSDSLLWRGPEGWGNFLKQQRIHTRNRYARLQQLLEALETEARSANLPLVALKGVALHGLGIYAPGERPMADLDLLARPADAGRAHQLLGRLGFQATYADSRHRVYEPIDARPAAPFGEHSANALKVELHTRVAEALPLRAVDVSELIFPEQPIAGMNTYPSKAALMAHLLLHAAGSMAQRAVRLVQLHDIAGLSSRMERRDWEPLLSLRPALNEAMWWAFPPLALTARYYSSVPQEVLNAAAAHCPWLLQRSTRHQTLSDVSLSNLWVVAFPAIKWARSVPEAVRYAAARISPSEEMRAQRLATAKSQHTAGGSWEHLSQVRRILRWLTSQTARPETLVPVQRALQEAS